MLPDKWPVSSIFTYFNTVAVTGVLDELCAGLTDKNLHVTITDILQETRKCHLVIFLYTNTHTQAHQNACSVTTGRMLRLLGSTLTYWISQLPASKVLKYMSEDCKPQPDPHKLDLRRHFKLTLEQMCGTISLAATKPDKIDKKKLTFLQVKRRYNSWWWSAFRRKPHPHQRDQCT